MTIVSLYFFLKQLLCLPVSVNKSNNCTALLNVCELC